MSYKPEVIADSTGTWAGNALRFATEEEALANAKDLMARWTSVREIRATESDDPVTHQWDDANCKLIVIDYEPRDPPGWEGGFADNH
jgi:hypothetical protein